jgi:signal peptidase I
VTAAERRECSATLGGAVSEDLPALDEPSVTVDRPLAEDEADMKGDTATDNGAGRDTVDDDELGVRHARRRAHRRRNTIEWIVVLAGALVIAVLIKTFLFQAFYIPSDSMEPTLKVGDRVLVNKLSYRLHGVHDGDIVVFDRPSTAGQTVQGCDGNPVTIPPQASFSSEEVHDLIKRVIATSGQTVEQRDGKVYVNGQPLDEPYVHETNGVTDKTPAFRFSAQCVKVPDGKVFVLGDNRTDSNASNMFGPIPEDSIVGRAFVRVWPIGDIGGL